jgi:hypothetical protein
MGRFNEINQRLLALERQQQMVITDPTKTNGDPNHGYACVVTGSLLQTCGINSFGLGYWTASGAWKQLTT